MQQYVVDYLMDGIQPYYLTPLPIIISNLTIPTSIPADTPFDITYQVTNNTGFSQMIYGKLIDNATGQPISSPTTEWGPQLMQNGESVNIDNYFSSGIKTMLNATLNVGHVEYALSIASNNPAWGTATITNPTTSYYPGQNVTIQATSNPGYKFDYWSGGASGSANPLTISMKIGDAAITANFSLEGMICNASETQCINGFWNTCNPTGDAWVPSELPCQADIPVEYIIIGGVAVVGGLIAIAAATGGLGGYAIGKRRAESSNS